MSSTHPLSSSSSEPKKKFGKNLNKLTKPPPPSISSISAPSLRVGATASALSSRNGLHLLSTKRSNSVSSTSSGILLGAKSKSSSSAFSQSSNAKTVPRPLNTPSLRSESSNDAALLSTSGGNGPSGWGSTVTAETVPAQTAWGSIEKSSHQTTQTSTNLVPKGRLSAIYRTPHSSLNPSRSSSSLQQLKVPNESLTNNNEKSSSSRQHTTGRSTRWSGDVNDDDDECTRDSFKHDQKSSNRNDTKFHYVSNTFKDLNENDIPTHRSSENMSSTKEQFHSRNLQQNNLLMNETILSNNLPKSGNDASDSLSKEDNLSNGNKVLSKSSIDMKGTDTTSAPKPSLSPGEDHASSFIGTENNSLADVDDQVEYMKRRARERTEERRAEEERRTNEQKSRAARRLKELEDKILHGNASKVGNEEDLDDINKISKLDNQKRDDKKNEKMNWRSQHVKSGHPPAEHSIKKNSEIVLERLGRSNDSNATSIGVKKTNESIIATSATTRKLFDPNRTYSSLVGGGNRYKSSPTTSSHQQRPPSPPPVLQISLQASKIDQFHIDSKSREVDNSSPPPISVIQLNSYEDRDRGLRNVSSGPRMLFDPKSGSMIHAPSLDKRNLNNYTEDHSQAAKGRKDRNKLKSRGRDRDTKGENIFSKRTDPNNSTTMEDSMRRRKQSDDLNESNEGKGSRRHRKKDDGNANKKDRKRIDRDSKYHQANGEHLERNTHSFGRQGIIHDDSNISPQSLNKRYGARSVLSRQQSLNEVTKMPRTRGVLYKVDESGNYICADGCEADQGYGAHSVPGGRVRNPSAHAEYLGRYQKYQQSLAETPNYNDYESQHITERQYDLNTFSQPITNQSMLRTDDETDGLNRTPDEYNYNRYNAGKTSPGNSAFKDHSLPHFNLKKSSIENNGKKGHDAQVMSTTENYDIPAELRVKANETLSILSGVPDSPELQATAHPWAPNEAALAAAAANSTLQMQKSDTSESSRNVTAEMMRIIDESEDDLDNSEIGSNSSFVGLGFDPTENMDTMMMSPSIHSTHVDDDVSNIVNLSLEPAQSKPHNNPFASLGTPNRFLGSSTWGAAGTLSRSPVVDPIGSLSMSSLNWDMLGGKSVESEAKTLQDENKQDQKHIDAAATFLPLSPLQVNQDGDTWGTGRFGGGITGLNGNQLPSIQPSNDGSNVNE